MTPVKPFLEHGQLIFNLRDCGVEIDDDSRASIILQRFGYHRLSGYRYLFREHLAADQQDHSARRFRSKRHIPGTRLTDIVKLMEFDAGLRSRVLQGTEDLEVRLRTAVAHAVARRDELGHLSITHLDRSQCNKVPRYGTRTSHEIFVGKVRKETKRIVDDNDDFAVHHQSVYGTDLPVWAIVEHLPFDSLIHLLNYLKTEDKREVAEHFGVRHPKQFVKWIRAMLTLRNSAAHGVRLFNRPFKTAIVIPSNATLSPLLGPTRRFLDGPHDHERPHNRLYPQVAVLAYLLRCHPAGTDWHLRLKSTIGQMPWIQVGSDTQPLLSPRRNMAFPPDWDQQDLWNP
ncbi:Abi family protein [Corynebacterium suedekumii]|uniref:Abi family protein n=1 Tax=Corynebacterium suedekumii TaxID=3049801 RepID=A0ABY8VRQ7_9CORY|nr:Abi family protein [Corynebacterium suedekumii]WIM70235.1 Abi family protein [Corynebacterium suedekumii]